MEYKALACKSQYITLPDSTRLAVSYWLNAQNIDTQEKYPAIVNTTRYWRARSYHDDQLEYEFFYNAASYFCSKGYAFVIVDVRGTGASFGHRDTEIPQEEVEDINPIIEWVSQQPWCNGKVATEGTSYTANTTLYSLVTAPPSLKLGVCRAPDFDDYRNLVAPGGIVNRWFVRTWGLCVKALDQNDVDALYADGYSPPPACGADNVLGVRPVDEDTDGSLLPAAIADHKANYSLVEMEESLHYIDNPLYDNHRAIYDPQYQKAIEHSQVPLVMYSAWHDAGTQLGILAMFASFDAPIRVIIDPWNHGGNQKSDPFQAGDGMSATARTMDEVRDNAALWLNRFLKQDKEPAIDQSRFRGVDYYTLGENRWKSTATWPLPNTNMQRWYLAESNQLSQTPSSDRHGCDGYQIDASTTTGVNNRWHAQTAGKPILFPDRQEADKKCLVYDTPPLENDTEITGHPVVCLWLISDATDGQFFVYLETVDTDGRVRMLTDGQLRGMHRKVSTAPPPYKMFGPYHSLKQKDAEPMVPGEITEITFDLFPLSVLLKKGQRIRVAIAGADKDTFAPIKGCETPEITVERNQQYSSYIDLPIIPTAHL